MPENATATLCAHSGAVKISRGDLIHVPTPPRTLTFMPVAHSTLIDLIENNLTRRGFGILNSEFAIQEGKLDGKALMGAKLFATLVLKHQTSDDFAFALGLRAANDKSMAIELVAGCKVFVCDNMALCGEADLLWRKHTSGLDRYTLRTAVDNGLTKAITRFGSFGSNIEVLKQRFISDTEAKANIYDAVVKGVIPQAFLPKVGAAYFEPPHKEFEPRTMWSLQNSYTEIFRTEYATKPHLLLESTQALGTFFGL